MRDAQPLESFLATPQCRKAHAGLADAVLLAERAMPVRERTPRMPVRPRYPILSHKHVFWLRDIMRDAGCSRLEREAMERHLDGEGLVEAAASLGHPCGTLRAHLSRCRGNLAGLREDVDEVLESAAVDFAAAMRHQGKGGGSKDPEETPLRPEAAQVMEQWIAWAWEATWE